MNQIAVLGIGINIISVASRGGAIHGNGPSILVKPIIQETLLSISSGKGFLNSFFSTLIGSCGSTSGCISGTSWSDLLLASTSNSHGDVIEGHVIVLNFVISSKGIAISSHDIGTIGRDAGFSNQSLWDNNDGSFIVGIAGELRENCSKLKGTFASQTSRDVGEGIQIEGIRSIQLGYSTEAISPPHCSTVDSPIVDSSV